MTEITTGDGWSVGDLDALGEGPGFRKVRAALGVTEFGVNAIVLPPGLSTPTHFHDRQQELYFVHRGRIEFTLGGERRELGPGGFVRVDAGTVRSVRNVSETDEAIFVAVGAEGGYVGRDGRRPEEASA
jgi:quercetin dioxygenase-like cupin family protein